MRRWRQNPLRLGAIAPSSRFLARAVVEASLPKAIAAPDIRVIELGSGTGIFTQELLRRGVRPEHITCVELDPELASYVQKKFPGIRVVCCSATELKEKLDHQRHSIHAIVSGLPMLAIGKEAQHTIMEGAHFFLAPQGIFAQFTYSLWSPITVRELSTPFHHERKSFVLWNLPPATVWSYTPN